jgi:SAM-dependent methyltransferase
MSSKANKAFLNPYSGEFFDELEQAMLQSARVVVPLVLRLVNPASVLDIGCGRGAWLRVFQELGVKAVQGLDGEYVEQSRLLVPPECFTCTDLSKPFKVPGRYDLAVCLEVGEHLPHAMAPLLIDRLVEAAPAVLFSAAIPGQGGVNHINERMPAYWRALFREHGYALLDPLRPAILTDPRIDFFYRQNIVLYVAEKMIRAIPELEAYRMPDDGLGIEWVQAYLLDRQKSVGCLGKELVAALGRAVHRRTDRLARLFRLRANT